MLSLLAGGQLGMLAEAHRISLPHPLQVGLVGMWRFDEASGDALDSSGNNRTLTNGGAATFGSGKLNNCAVLSGGANSFFYHLTEAAFQGSLNFGVAIWVKSTVAGTYLVMCKDNLSGVREWALYVDWTTWNWITFVGGSYYLVPILTGWNDGNWHLVVGTTDAGTVRISYDGGAFVSGATAPSAINAGGARVDIGNRNGSNIFNGSLDAAYIWNRALTAADVALLWNSGNGIQVP